MIYFPLLNEQKINFAYNSEHCPLLMRIDIWTYVSQQYNNTRAIPHCTTIMVTAAHFVNMRDNI